MNKDQLIIWLLEEISVAISMCKAISDQKAPTYVYWLGIKRGLENTLEKVKELY